MRKQVGLQGEKVQAIKELSSFFNAVNQTVFHFKPNGFDFRKAIDVRLLTLFFAIHINPIHDTKYQFMRYTQFK